MIRRSFFVFLVMMSHALGVYAGFTTPCDNTFTIQPEFSRITVISRCTFKTFGVQNPAILVKGDHEVTPGNNLHVYCQGDGYCGTSIVVSPYPASTTFVSIADFKAYEHLTEIEHFTMADSIRTPGPTRPRTDCPNPSADNTCPPTGNFCQETDEFCNVSPIVLNLGKGTYKLSGVETNPVLFDLDADGTADMTGWTEPDGQLAFLALDRNHNFRIDDGSELFGDATALVGTTAANGFEALRRYDGNGDGAIDGSDPIWSELLLWQDANHNGESERAELSSITTSGITLLQLSYRWTGKHDSSGNALRYMAMLETTRGRKPYYDVFFRLHRQR